MNSDDFNMLRLACEGLERADIPYMLTGSFAANFYAVPRMTRDIDIIVQIFESDMDKFVLAFEKHFYLDRRTILEAVEYRRMFNIINLDTAFKIDFIMLKNSSYRQTEFQRKRRVTFNGVEVWIVSPEDLIISKLDWAKDSLSEMQMRDVKNLLMTLKNLDKTYLHQWIQTLQLDAIYAKVEES
jgi:hypothetical protein